MRPPCWRLRGSYRPAAQSDWRFRSPHPDAGISLLLAIPIGFLVGVILEVILIRRMYHRPLDTLLVTWG